MNFRTNQFLICFLASHPSHRFPLPGCLPAQRFSPCHCYPHGPIRDLLSHAEFYEATDFRRTESKTLQLRSEDIHDLPLLTPPLLAFFSCSYTSCLCFSNQLLITGLNHQAKSKNSVGVGVSGATHVKEKVLFKLTNAHAKKSSLPTPEAA